MMKTVLFNIVADQENRGEQNYYLAHMAELQKHYADQIDNGDLQIVTMRLNHKSQSEPSASRTNNMPTSFNQVQDETPLFDAEAMAEAIEAVQDTGAKIILYGHGKSTFIPLKNAIEEYDWCGGYLSKLIIHFSTHELTSEMLPGDRYSKNLHIHIDRSTAALALAKDNDWVEAVENGDVTIHSYGKMFALVGGSTVAADWEKMKETDRGGLIDAWMDLGYNAVVAVSSAGWRAADKSPLPVTEAETYAHGAALARTALLQGPRTAIVVISPGPRVEIDQEAGHDSFGAYVKGVESVLPVQAGLNYPLIVVPFVKDSGYNAINAMLAHGDRIKVFEANAENFGLFDTLLEELPATTIVQAHRINQLIDSEGNKAYSDTRDYKLMDGANKGMTILVGQGRLQPTAGGFAVTERNPFDPVPLKDKTPAQLAALRDTTFASVNIGAARPAKGYDPVVDAVAILARDFAPSNARPQAKAQPVAKPAPGK